MRHPGRTRTALLSLVLAAALAPASVATPGRASLDPGYDLLEDGRFEAAAAYFERALAQRPGDPEALYGIGRVTLERGETEAAIEHFEGAVERRPGSSRLHQGLGEAYGVAAVEAPLWRQALLARRTYEALERAIELDPENVGARMAMFEYQRRAPALLGGGRDRAEAQAAAIGRLEPSRGWELRGYLLQDEDRDDEALVAYRRAVAADPGNQQAQLALALLHTRRREYDQAFERLDAVLARRPDHAGALYQLGRNAALSGRRLGAGRAALERYLERRPRMGQPSHAWAWYRLGTIHHRQGRHDAARTAYRRSVALDGSLDGPKAALAKLPEG